MTEYKYWAWWNRMTTQEQEAYIKYCYDNVKEGDLEGGGEGN